MNILITSVGRRTYLVEYFKSALGSQGEIHVANSNNYTNAFSVADKYVISPHIYSNEYINFLLGYSKRNNIEAVISLFDLDLNVLSYNKRKFEEQGIKLLVSDYELINTCNDKLLFYRYLKKYGFYTPSSFIEISDVKECLSNGVLQFPLILKPRMGMGSIGLFQADNLKELEIFYKKTKQVITGSYLKHASDPTIYNDVIIQEKITGDEYGLDILNNLDGNLEVIVPKLKMEMRAGETNIAKITNSPELIKLGEDISIKTKHIGNLEVDCIFANNKYYIIEMNCRFGGQYPFAHLAGVDFPKAIINMLSGISVGPELLKFRTDIIGIKDLVPVILDIS